MAGRGLQPLSEAPGSGVQQRLRAPGESCGASRVPGPTSTRSRPSAHVVMSLFLNQERRSTGDRGPADSDPAGTQVPGAVQSCPGRASPGRKLSLQCPCTPGTHVQEDAEQGRAQTQTQAPGDRKRGPSVSPARRSSQRQCLEDCPTGAARARPRTIAIFGRAPCVLANQELRGGIRPMRALV